MDFILKINQCLSNAAHYNTKSEFLESTSKSTSKLHVSVAKVVHNIIGGYLSDKLVQTGEEMRFLSLMSKKKYSPKGYLLLAKFLNGDSTRSTFLRFGSLRDAVKFTLL